MLDQLRLQVVPKLSARSLMSFILGFSCPSSIYPIPVFRGLNVRTGLLAVISCLLYAPVRRTLRRYVTQFDRTLLISVILLILVPSSVTIFRTPPDLVGRGLLDCLLLATNIILLGIVTLTTLDKHLSLAGFVLGAWAGLSLISANGFYQMVMAHGPSLSCVQNLDLRSCLRPSPFGTVLGTFFAAAAAFYSVYASGTRARNSTVERICVMSGLVFGLAVCFSRAPVVAMILGTLPAICFASRSFRFKIVVAKNILFFATLAVGLQFWLVASFRKSMEGISGHQGSIFVEIANPDSGTMADRMLLWNKMIAGLSKYPLFGHGFSSYRIFLGHSGMTTSETFFLEILYCGGLLTLLAVVAFGARIGKGQKKLELHSAMGHLFFWPLFSAGAVMLLCGQTNPTCWTPSFWIIAGVLVGILRQREGKFYNQTGIN